MSPAVPKQGSLRPVQPMETLPAPFSPLASTVGSGKFLYPQNQDSRARLGDSGALTPSGEPSPPRHGWWPRGSLGSSRKEQSTIPRSPLAAWHPKSTGWSHTTRIAPSLQSWSPSRCKKPEEQKHVRRARQSLSPLVEGPSIDLPTGEVRAGGEDGTRGTRGSWSPRHSLTPHRRSRTHGLQVKKSKKVLEGSRSTF